MRALPATLLLTMRCRNSGWLKMMRPARSKFRSTSLHAPPRAGSVAMARATALTVQALRASCAKPVWAVNSIPHAAAPAAMKEFFAHDTHFSTSMYRST
jgi:hypothetical protein